MSVALFDVSELAAATIILSGARYDARSVPVVKAYAEQAERLSEVSKANHAAFACSYRGEAADDWATPRDILEEVRRICLDHKSFARVPALAQNLVTLGRCNLVAQDGTDFATMNAVDTILELAVGFVRSNEMRRSA